MRRAITRDAAAEVKTRSRPVQADAAGCQSRLMCKSFHSWSVDESADSPFNSFVSRSNRPLRHFLFMALRVHAFLLRFGVLLQIPPLGPLPFYVKTLTNQLPRDFCTCKR